MAPPVGPHSTLLPLPSASMLPCPASLSNSAWKALPNASSARNTALSISTSWPFETARDSTVGLGLPQSAPAGDFVSASCVRCVSLVPFCISAISGKGSSSFRTSCFVTAPLPSEPPGIGAHVVVPGKGSSGSASGAVAEMARCASGSSSSPSSSASLCYPGDHCPPDGGCCAARCQAEGLVR